MESAALISQEQESYYYYTEISSNKTRHLNQKKKGKVLLVEDNQIVLKANECFLKDLGYQVDTALDGKTVLNLFDDSYDLVILDLGLPDIDGVTLCRYMRSREKERRVPIMILTVSAKDREFECRLAGADLYVKKPLPVTDLIQSLEEFGLE